MSVYLVVLLISVTTFWLVGHLAVKQRFAELKSNLSDIYHAAIAIPPEEGKTPRLVALGVDLIRRAHCTAPFSTLTAREQRLALHAHAVEVLPDWMSRYAALGLFPQDRALIAQLRQVKSSRPMISQQPYNTAIRDRLQARRTQAE